MWRSSRKYFRNGQYRCASGQAKDIRPEKRFLSILVAFGVGCSIYFFLDDPRKSQNKEVSFLSHRQFLKAQLTSSEESTSATKLIELAVPNLVPPGLDNFSPLWSVYIKDDDIQIERPYTPLRGISSDGRMLFWIKKYTDGELSQWIHSKTPGDKLEIRFPLQTWKWEDDVWDEVVMISGGTGITPFVQLFNTKIINLPVDSKTRFTLLHSSRTPGELPPPEILNPLTAFAKEQPARFKLHVFVDSDDGSKSTAITPLLNIGRINANALQEHVEGLSLPTYWWSRIFANPQPEEDFSTKRIIFLVCGPTPMIDAIAGPYGRNFSQGPIGGILGKLGFTSNQVYKI